MLEVQIICPVEEVDHDKRQREDESGVVVYVVGVLHVTAVYGANDFAKGDQNGEAPVGGLRGRCLGLGLTAGGAGGAHSELRRGGSWGWTRSVLLAPLGSGVPGDGRDDAVHFVVEVVQVVAVL